MSSPTREWLSNIASGPVEMVPVHLIVPGRSPRVGGQRSAEYIRILMETDTALPPIIVHRPTMGVIDGNLRLLAAVEMCERSIGVRFFDGSREDAFALSVYVNVRHGVPLSLSERKAAAGRLVMTHPEWSDRSIAATTGLSHKTVSTERRRASGENAQSHTRLGKDGRVRPTDTSEGRLAAAAILKENPDASLRQVSKIVGISPGTVRDVRERLKRSEHPIPQAVRDRLDPNASRAQDTGRPHAHGSEIPMENPGAIAIPIQQVLLQNLRNDPALKFNERGRLLLRSLAYSMIDLDQWVRMTGEAPEHCRATLAKLARANAESWSALAVRLEAGGPTRLSSRLSQANG
ncbi:winged helix-turn-helix domain-containing protein [Nocardia jejuensis]|uniref:winged helix-turn-helix domain-containing protein n=1 Tax=Nocardia jejuensis TaxID=328049 RepID=UPI0009FDBA89|nr:winged helix-turn-helix domain-containing protein [Nocardia jejuensis]